MARDMQETEEEEDRLKKECAAQNFRKDADKRARQQAEQHGGRYNEIAKVHLTVMVSLRGLDSSGNKATLVQKLIEDDNERKNNDDKDNNDQTQEDSIQEIQQAKPPDLLQKDDCPICFSKTEEDNRIHNVMFTDRCCGNWQCVTCCNKWIAEPRCPLCNVDKTEDRLSRATAVLLD